MGDLQLDIKFQDPDSEGRVSIEATGEDIQVLKSFLQKHFGLLPKSIRPGKIFRAYVKDINETKEEMSLEVGVSESPLVLPRLLLQKALGSGSVPFTKLASAFCLRPNFPVEVSVREFGKDNAVASLSRAQRAMFLQWSADLLDRIIVLGTTRRSVKNALAKTGNLRNITDSERLAFFTQCIPVKLGLDSLRITKTLENELAPTEVCLFDARNAWKLLN